MNENFLKTILTMNHMKRTKEQIKTIYEFVIGIPIIREIVNNFEVDPNDLVRNLKYEYVE